MAGTHATPFKVSDDVINVSLLNVIVPEAFNVEDVVGEKLVAEFILSY